MYGQGSTILEYAKLYKEFVVDDIGKEKEYILMGLRTQLIAEGEEKLLQVVERCIDYENYGGSEELVQFIQLTKKLVISVHNNAKTVYKYTKQWEDKNPMDKYRTDPSKCIDNLTAAELTKVTYEYLASVV